MTFAIDKTCWPQQPAPDNYQSPAADIHTILVENGFGSSTEDFEDYGELD